MAARLFLLMFVLFAAPAWAATDTLEPVKKAVADDVARLCAEDMHFRFTGRTLVIAPLRNDPNGIVAAALKDHLSSSGLFDVKEKSTLREYWDKLVGNDKDAPITFDQALEFGKKADVECVLFGRVEKLVIDETRSFADIKIRIVEVKEPHNGVFIGRYSSAMKASLLSQAYFQVWMSDTSLFMRILIWVVILLILPFLTLLARETLSSAAPVVPIGLVLLMTGIDMALALLMMGFNADSIVKWGLLVGALAISIFYNLMILAKVAQLQLPGRD